MLAFNGSRGRKKITSGGGAEEEIFWPADTRALAIDLSIRI